MAKAANPSSAISTRNRRCHAHPRPEFYDRHHQANAIDFINTVIARFPFRIREVRTDNGHEFQAKFHWHVEDQGIRHAYIKPASPQLNGKLERSHRTDEQEFYQLLTYTDDIDLGAKLSQWENFYNLSRPSWVHSMEKHLTRPPPRTAINGCLDVSQPRPHYRQIRENPAIHITQKSKSSPRSDFFFL